MEPNELMSRVAAETGVSVAKFEDRYDLAGMFNRYRPDGRGLDRLFSADGVEGEVRDRIKRVFAVSATSWKSTDIYFVIGNYEKIEMNRAVEFVTLFLREFSTFSGFVGDAELCGSLNDLRLVQKAPEGVRKNGDIEIMMHELLGDFLAKFSPKDHPIFWLDEAIYSMANDYCLLTYIIWPVIRSLSAVPGAIDSYFDLWRYGIKLEFFEGNLASLVLPL